MKNPLYLFLLSTVMLTSCVKEFPRPGQIGMDLPHSANEHSARPVDTDPQIKTQNPGNSTQLAYYPVVNHPAGPRLFVMIPGTLSNPNDYRAILKTAAKNGYHSMGIAYSNTGTLADLCDGSSDPDCSARLLEEYLTGENTSNLVDVPRAESFENRIQKMISYLNANYPEEGWDSFLNKQGDIFWERISLAGHSQGSTHTLYISRKRKLLRASFFSGPNGFKSNGQYPDWLTRAGLTPNTEIYVFNHRADRLSEWGEALDTWDAIGIAGNKISVDTHDDFEGSHRLYTYASKMRNLFTGAHGAHCTDKDTPLNRNGQPRFTNVWKYMSFP